MLPRLRKALHSTHGAIDVASVVVGVLVVGLVASATLTTVFGVVPWSQDNAAKATLGEVSAAQAVFASGTAKYGTYAELKTKKLLPEVSGIGISLNSANNCYLAVVKSTTGNFFYNTSSDTDIETYHSGATATCGDLAATVNNIGGPVAAPGNGGVTPPQGNQPAVRMVDVTQSVVYAASANNYNKHQMLLNVVISGSGTTKKDWELRVRSDEFVEQPYNQILSYIQVNDSRVYGEKQGTEYSFKNTALGEYGNTVSSTSSFSTTIVFEFDIRVSDNIVVTKANPSGGQWYATQNVSISTPSNVYVYWKVRVDLTNLRQLGSSTTKITINNSNVKITQDTGNFYWIEPLNDNAAVAAGYPFSFDIAATN